MVLVKRVALLLIRSDDFFEDFHIQCMAFRLIDAVNQLPDICPAMLIKGNSDRFRLMAKDQGNELACILISTGSPAPHL